MNTRHLRPEDLRGRRWRGLVRESSQEQAEKWSPQRQRKDLERAASELGLEPSEPRFYERTGSGEDEGVDELALAVADARAGQYDVLLVLHTSRFARNRAESVKVKAEAKKVGLVIYFVEQRIISGTLASGLHEGVAEVIDEHENEQRRFWIAGGHRERQLAGQWLGAIPVGYREHMVELPNRTVGWDGTLEEDPVYGPIVRRIFDMVAAGWAPYQIARHLNAEGLRTPRGRLWQRPSLGMILRNPVYKGLLVRYRDNRHEHYYPEADPHDGRREIPMGVSLIEPALFDQVQAILATRAHASGTRRAYPLSTILRCRGCGTTMSGATNGFASYYRCRGRLEYGTCEQPYVRGDVAEAAFADWLNGFRLPDDWRSRLMRRERPARDEQAKKERITAAIARLKQQYQWGDVTEAEYRAEMQSLRTELGSTERPAESDLEQYADALIELGSTWAVVSPERKAAVARLILDSAVAEGGTIVEWVVRASVRPVLDLCVVDEGRLYPATLRYTA